jgi:hypothetical protein
VTSRVAALVLGLLGCTEQLDAGTDSPHGALPVDERSAIVTVNDGPRDNWQGEYAAVLAASGRVKWVGMVVNSTPIYPMLADNVIGFRSMVEAARSSRMQGIPDATASVSPILVRPASGVVEDTVPNRSEGARLILEAAARHGSAVHPLVIATGSAVTDAADAYLMDPSLRERAVVVSSLGNVEETGVRSGDPNGNIDAWAITIVSSRMRYAQINGFYDQLLDLPEERVAELPKNPFGAWMTEKRPEILDLISACDQISVLAAALPWFATSVTRMSGQFSEDIPLLLPDAAGQIWHVSQSDSERARNELWVALQDPATYR